MTRTSALAVVLALAACDAEQEPRYRAAPCDAPLVGPASSREAPLSLAPRLQLLLLTDNVRYRCAPDVECIVDDVERCPVDFGEVAVGSERVALFALNNLAPVTMALRSVPSWQGGSCEGFALVEPIPDDKVDPDTAAAFSIAFRPRSEGSCEATLLVTTDAENASENVDTAALRVRGEGLP